MKKNRGIMFKKKGKRGVVEVQFNWIFVMIAGGLILFFFTTIISGQKATSEKKLHTDLVNQFELIFAGQGVATGTKNQIDLPSVPLQFGCSDYAIGEQAKTLGNAVVFSPMVIESKKMLTSTLAWQMPFKVGNFVYLTAPNMKYYFVGFSNPDVQKAITDAMPLGEDYYQFVDSEQDYQNLQYERNPFVKFVFNYERPDRLPESFLSVGDEQVRAVLLEGYVVGPYDFTGSLRLKFFKKNGIVWEEDTEGIQENSFPVLKFETFLGAVFAGNAELFQCNMRRALLRLKYVANVYDQKMKLLFSNPKYNCVQIQQEGPATTPQDACCEAFASIEFSEMSKLIGANGLFAENVRGPEFGTWENLLQQKNENAMRGSCPTLY